jgi:hypothetical protein
MRKRKQKQCSDRACVTPFSRLRTSVGEKKEERETREEEGYLYVSQVQSGG